jgi:signal transduction histidine kinase
VKNLSKKILFYLFLDILLISICAWHLPSIFKRARPPFHAEQIEQNIVVERIIDTHACGGLKTRDILVSWKGCNLEFFETLEFYSNFNTIGESVFIEYKRGDTTALTSVRLIPYYLSIRYIIIIIFVGIVIFGVGIFILLNGPPEQSTRSLHWALVSLAVSVLLTTGLMQNLEFSSYIFETVFYFFYMMTVCQFFYFSLLFPKVKYESIRLIKQAIFIPSFIFISILVVFRLRAIYTFSLDDLVNFQRMFDIFHVLLFVFVGGGIFNFVRAYQRSQIEEEGQKLKWILWGLIIGATPFLVLSIGPQLFDKAELIQEEFTLIFFLVIPFAFAMAIVRYQFLNIDVLINRTILYSILTLLIGAIYILAVLVVTSAIGGEAVFDEYLLIIAITFLIAVSFNSLRTRLQKLIDESFFSARENYRKMLAKMSTDFHNSLSSESLFKRISENLQAAIPVKNIMIYRYENEVLSAISKPSIPINKNQVQVLAQPNHVFATYDFTRSEHVSSNHNQTDFLKRIGCNLAVPLVSGSKKLLALLVCDPQQEGTLLIDEEIDLLLNGCIEASEVLERLFLQEKMILENEEKLRLQHLNEMKSLFVSSVTHELKTPLTSIKMFAELMKNKKHISNTEKSEFFSIIEGESERLTELVNNVLDFSKIEQGQKDYHFEQVDLNKVIERALLSMKYQLKQHNFEIKTVFKKNLSLSKGDADSLHQAMLNLISNSIKYSPKEKNIFIRTFIENSFAVITISDKGSGISKKDQKNIFKNYYRAAEGQKRDRSGAGLGLAIVKNIIDAHQGKIEVESKLDQGTTFTIYLPLEN